MGVPFLDLSRLHRSIAPELEAAYREVVEASALVGATTSAAFETAFAAASGRGWAAGCGSGTDALTLALVALGLGPGDEVVVPAMTFVATAEAVLHAGAVPVIADVDAASLLLSPGAVDAVRTARTRAVLPVHLYGHVVPFDVMEEWRASGLVVVEDAAQAHLARWRGGPVGDVGHAACFSFYPGKNLGALGDGGAVVADDHQVISRVAALRDHGSVHKGRHDVVGWCSRLDGLQAAWLEVKLRHLPRWTARRRALAERYRALLPAGLLVDWEDGAVHHLVVVRVPSAERTAVIAELAAAGVQTGIHFPLALSQQPAMARWARPCPQAERAAGELVSLPLDPLMDEAEVDIVASALLAALGRG
ncbi:MAG TPA: DegT/DnrJ/EryC1/StrS family aminotransferase [Acidimicrobiales bacterium]|nr:DegT/DnrJ/EryC1/StrS family aminotransferase [Acidimicrobiales bacterium]